MVTVFIADYSNVGHAKGVREMLSQYARDPMGGGEALPDDVLDNVVPELTKRGYAYSVLVHDEAGKPVGLANCFEGFSTFAGKALVNIHDFYIAPSHRGKGLSQMLLQAVEEEAKARSAVKLTLEVLHGNNPAKGCYKKFGFEEYKLSEEVGSAMFWHKKIKSDT